MNSEWPLARNQGLVPVVRAQHSIAADPTRTDAEDRVMKAVRAALETEGIDVGLPPVGRQKGEGVHE